MNYYTIYKVFDRMIPEHSGMFFTCFHFYYSCFWEAFALTGRKADCSYTQGVTLD